MTRDKDSTIADRMREAREASGLSQGQVARKLDLHRPTISEIEAGRRKVSAQELEMFAELYGVTTEWIISGATQNDSADESIRLAARELSKMSGKDLDRLMKMLKMIRKVKP